MKGLKRFLGLFLLAFLAGCRGDPSFVYSVAPQAITSNKQAELRSAVVLLAHRYNLHAVQLASAEDPDAIGFIGSPDNESGHRLSFAYAPRRNAVIIQLLYGPDEHASSKTFRVAVEAELTRIFGANGFSVEKGSGVRSIAS